MRSSKFTEEQIAFALKQADTGTPVKEVIRHLGITEQTYYRWRKEYGGMKINQAKRLRELEKENSRLKKLVAGERIRTKIPFLIFNIVLTYK